jgi:peptide/nickel transport system substrate-binding protein
LTALAGGEVDAIYEFGIEQMPLAQSIEGQVIAIRTAQTMTCKMRVDQEPFTDKRVRQAIAKSLDNARSRRWCSPKAAMSARTTTWRRSIPNTSRCRRCSATWKGAKALLQGSRQGNLEVTIDIGNTDGPWHQALAEAMRDQAPRQASPSTSM